MRVIAIGLIGFAVAATACAPKRTNQCASNTTGHCVFGEKCSFDQARGCQVCVCEPPEGDGANPQRQGPGDPTPLR